MDGGGVKTQIALPLTPPEPAPAPDIRSALGDRVVGTVARLFELMAVAEAEAAKAGRPDAFRFLCPTPVLRGKSVEFYRAHVREMLGRLQRGEDLEPGTDAECLCVMFNTALVAPLRQDGQAVTEWLFAQVFPDRASEVGCGRTPERWEGQVLEDVAQLRRRPAARRGGEG